MIFGSPIWFWFGVAIAIPVFIHLWNHRSGNPRLLGTFRFLPDETFASARRLELHEIPLLLVRTGIVILILLLLIDVFWKSEKLKADQVGITEKATGPTQWLKDQEGIPTLEISSQEIKEKGWWNILAQMDYLHQPEHIVARGHFGEEKFSGKRAKITASIEWQSLDSLNTTEKELARWRVSDNNIGRFIQQRTGFGVSSNIGTQEILDEEANYNTAILFLNRDNSAKVNAGLRYTAAIWHIETEEKDLNEEETAQLMIDGDTWSLFKHTNDDKGVQDFVESNAITGIRFQVSKMDTSFEAEEILLRSKIHSTAFLFRRNEREFVVNGIINPEVESWIFAGVSQQLMLHAFGIKEVLTPFMNEDQRTAITSSFEKKAPQEKRSANTWLLGIMVILWLAERNMAPKRGM